jgi:methylphosphotriester-DNA--protein-cysteine methyltransferase
MMLKLKMKKMELTKEEVEALKAYFDETNINITSLIKKIGLKKVKEFEAVIDKIYKDEK